MAAIALSHNPHAESVTEYWDLLISKGNRIGFGSVRGGATTIKTITPMESPISSSNKSRLPSPIKMPKDSANGHESPAPDESPLEQAGAGQPSSLLPSIEVDALTEMLGKTLKIQASAILQPRMVQVSKDYKLYSEVIPSSFYKARLVTKRIEKRRRDHGILSKSTQQRRHGFRPEELLWNGAIDLKDCRPSNLANAVHPLFCRDRFDDCPDAIYDQLIPGLQLATMFLTQPFCFQFWVTVANGERKMDADQSRRCGYQRERIEKNVPLTKANTSEVMDYINGLDKSELVHFTFQSKLKFQGGNAWATAKGICNYKIEQVKGPMTNIARHNVRLHADFLVAAQKLDKLVHVDVAQKLRFSFFLAVTIVHEMVGVT